MNYSQNKILSVFVFDAMTVLDEPKFTFYFWRAYRDLNDITVAENKFVDEVAFALISIARRIYQQEADCKISISGIIQK